MASVPPGTWFHYSNVGYKLVGLVLERVVGRDFGHIVQQRILDPLGMANTTPVITHDTRRRMAVGYEHLYDDRPAHATHPLVPATWLELDSADGSISSTAADMAAYLRMLLNRGQGPQGAIVSDRSFARLIQPVIESGDGIRTGFYGYGLEIEEQDGRTLVGHEGGMVGYYSAMVADLDEGVGAIVLTNGPGEPGKVARFALAVGRAVLFGQRLPSLPTPPDRTQVDDAAHYTGTYRSADRVFTLAPRDEQLVMALGGEEIVLERRRTDAFYAAHPDFSRFLLHFGRQEGVVVEAFHGPDWYTNGRYSGARDFPRPPEWSLYTGHYRAHNPWFSNFRVVARKDALLLIEPQGEEHILVPVAEGAFRVGADERSPERVRFDTVIDGRTVRADLSGCHYYRTFTP
jgi:CubicO group peptidase (beta-lactamase class C family)